MKIKEVLLLGAGLMSKPLVDFFLKNSQYRLVVLDKDGGKARSVIKDHPRGKSHQLDVNNTSHLRDYICSADIIVSLLPSHLDYIVAKLCVEFARPLVHSNYHLKEVLDLDNAARQKGVLLLGEMGLDPGIDHMTVKKMVDHFHGQGGEIEDFYSYCGGLPAPEANDNPFGYKFSWSPQKVLRVSNREAMFLKNGKEIHVSGGEVLKDHWRVKINPDMEFEAYANANSLMYTKMYNLKRVKNMLRGTLRYPGWCDIINVLKQLNLLNEKPLRLKETFSPLQMVIKASHFPNKGSLLHYNPISENIRVQTALKWLGLFDETPRRWRSKAAIDVLEEMMVEKLSYKPHERDMTVMIHLFGVRYKEGKRKFKATLVDYGMPGGYSSMAKTVSMTIAFAARAILENKIRLTGVQLPVSKEIYQLILPELENIGIRLKESEIND